MDEQLYLMGSGLDLDSKIQKAILNYQAYEAEALKADQEHGYSVKFSGGKDSIVIEDLAKKAGVKYESVYNQTTIDPPEVIRFLKQYYPNTRWIKPKVPFFKRAVDRGLPSRMIRWCCQEYKEDGEKHKVKVVGVRAEESVRRSQNWKIWTPFKGQWLLAPILYWTEQDVWQYIEKNNLPYPSLYNEGFKRLGCIGCPMGRKRQIEFDRWPGFAREWKRACIKNWELRHDQKHNDNFRYQHRFSSGEEMWTWWMSDNPSPKDDECQMGLF